MRRVWTLALVLSALAVPFAWRFSTQPSVAPSSTFDIPVGKRARYHFEHTSTGRVLLPLGPQADGIEIQIGLDGQIALDGLSKRAEGPTLGFSILELSGHRFELAGRSLIEDSNSLLGLRAEIDLDGRGRVTEIRFADGTPKLFESLRQLITSEIVLPMPEHAELTRWSAREHTQTGLVTSRFDRSGQHVYRTRTHYQQVEAFLSKSQVPVQSQADFTLGESGVASIEATEKLSTEALTRETHTRLALQDLIDAPSAGSMLAHGSTHHRGLAPNGISGETRQKLLEAWAADLPGEKLIEDLRLLAPLGPMPDHGVWFSKALARLRLEPTLREDFARLYHGENTFKGREVVLDLLVWEGSEASQVTFVELLDSEATRSSMDPSRLLQRLSLVEHPSTRTLDYLELSAFSGEGELRTAARYAAGAAAQRASKDSSPEVRTQADALVGRMAAALRKTNDAHERAELLSALGNAARPVDYELIAQFTRDDDPNVRVHAAGALRGYQGVEARDLLVSMSQDANGRVQRRALRALEKANDLSDEQLRRLSLGVRNRNIEERSLALLVNLAVPYTRETPAAAEILSAVLEFPFRGDPSVQARAQLLLDHPMTKR